MDGIVIIFAIIVWLNDKNKCENYTVGVGVGDCSMENAINNFVTYGGFLVPIVIIFKIIVFWNLRMYIENKNNEKNTDDFC